MQLAPIPGVPFGVTVAVSVLVSPILPPSIVSVSSDTPVTGIFAKVINAFVLVAVPI